MTNHRPTHLAPRLLTSAALTLALTLALALAGVDAFAQAGAPAAVLATPAPPASAASASGSMAPAAPRLRSAAETGNRAAAPGDLHPERPVTPQISIPFGKRAAPAARPDHQAPPRTNAAKAAPVGFDDSAARCESQADPRVRASCRARLAREAKARLPN